MKTEAACEGETEVMVSSSRSRDFLLRFSGGFSPSSAAEPNGSDSDEIELGLSLGGCFESANSHKNRILRSSSIPAILPCEVPPLFPLFRTCSLPDEEMQGKKRKREGADEELNGVSSPAALRWIAGDGVPSAMMKGVAPPASEQGSGVSVGSNSSGGSELESRSGQGFELSGFNHASERRSPSKFLTMLDQKNHRSSSFSPFSPTPILKPIKNNGGRCIVSNETLLRKNNGGRCSNASGELSKIMMKEMPVVSTKGDGPNGRRIEGFLYKYGRGEEVRIVCVCHGSFLTPTEFVKHAGGGDVAHPLRHIIVVNPSPAAFL